MAELLMGCSRGVAASMFFLIALALPTASIAAVEIEPGTTASDVAAEGGNVVEECDDTADATCTVVLNEAANEVGASVEVTPDGAGVASGEIFADLDVTGDGGGALVGSFLSAQVNVAGTLSSLGPNASASVQVSLLVRDTSSDVLVGAQTVVDESIADGTRAVSTSSAVAMPLPLTSGHSYRVSLLIRTQAAGSSADAAGALSDFASTASWSNLSVTAGEDPFARIDALETEVAALGERVDGVEADLAVLEGEVDQLREDFEGHSHTYLTGKGEGHNNTEAETGSPLLPGGEPAGGGEVADDEDGVDADSDLCPGTPAGAEIDANGCELAAFCALQERISVCSGADWQGDEPRSPRDCRWRSGACEPR